MEQLLELPVVTRELDRIDAVIDRLAAAPDTEIADQAITAERDLQIVNLARHLKLAWPWSVQQLQIGFWWRQQLVQAQLREARRTGLPPEPAVPGWPPKWTYDRRVLAVGGSPWALVNLELAPRFAMKRGDSLTMLQARWQAISARVDAIFTSSMFSTLIDEGPPGGTSSGDVAAYERYARWTVRWLVNGESYRRIAATELRNASVFRRAGEDQRAIDPRERWREIKRGVRKALEILDSI